MLHFAKLYTEKTRKDGENDNFIYNIKRMLMIKLRTDFMDAASNVDDVFGDFILASFPERKSVCH